MVKDYRYALTYLNGSSAAIATAISARVTPSPTRNVRGARASSRALRTRSSSALELCRS